MYTKIKNDNLPTRELILDLFRSQNRPLRLDAIIRLAGLTRKQKKNLDALLVDLEQSGSLVRFPGGKWALADRQQYMTGYFSSLDSGSGFVDDESGIKSKGLFILPHHTKNAWHGDLVRAVIEPGSGSRTGKIVEIIERMKKEIPARILKRQDNSLLCKPVDRRLHVNFMLPLRSGLPLAGNLRAGSLVLLHPDKELAPDLWEASLINIFGSESKISVQENLVKCSHDVPGEFPDLALSQARELPEQPSDADFAGRMDLRHIDFVTIDGPDARDFDDAIHVEKTPSGWLLRVAIADVSHYVRPDPRFGSLDQEALRRGNSWYFPTSVEPMLPKELSNGLCSLRPQENRLAIFATISFSMQGIPQKAEFGQAVICSAARLTYDQVRDFFQQRDKKFLPDPKLAPMLEAAHNLYRALANTARKRGALDFELPDPQYKFAANGVLESMGTAERNDAHKLIEQFMIAANEAVASFLGEKHASFLYRVHPVPEKDKTIALYDSLKILSPEILPAGLTPDDLRQPCVVQQILANAKGKPCEYIVNRLCLRSMPQARYQPENTGHFGLASSAYCHFTSPIRRYADLLTHRALAKILRQDKTPHLSEEKLASMGAQLNKLEREAMECEREMAKRLACVALRDREGEKTKGVISGVTDFGLFVELDAMPAEGLIRMSDLGNDYYIHEEKQQRLLGKRTGTIWKLGQSVTVKIQNVDPDRMEIRLCLAETKPVRAKGNIRSAKQHQKKSGMKTGKMTKAGKGNRDTRSRSGRSRPAQGKKRRKN